ncbi:MAG: hypothetical protein ACLP3B_22295 [Syntrophobacteraceae bacterium]
MTQRITITLPDGLYDRLQAVKDRINVSGVCQEAIMQAVGTEEVKAQDLPEMDKLLAKLQADKKRHDEIVRTQWRARGEQDGREDAHLIRYRDFLELERSLAFFAGKPVPPESEAIATTKATPTAISVTKRFQPLANRVAALKRENGFDENLYFAGWHDGVVSAWNAIKGKLLSPEDQTAPSGKE